MPEYTTSRGLRWHYETAGAGEAVLFIHGFGGNGAFWEAQKNFLVRDFQVITVDLPGHGQSVWMPVGINDMAIDIAQILNSLGVDHFSVVASSFGGLIAFELYRLLPGRVMRMSLVGAIPKFARGPDYPAGLDIERIRKMSQQFDGNYASILDIFYRSLFTPQERGTPEFDRIKTLRASGALPTREALKEFLTILEKTDLRDRLSSVICPLQFISGSADYICPPSIMEWMAQHTYNARFDVIEGAGHLPFLIEVTEYNRLLEDFLLS